MKHILNVLFVVLVYFVCRGTEVSGASHIEVYPSVRPNLQYSTALEQLVYSEDKTYGYMTYRVESFENDVQLGWATSALDLTIGWKDGKVTGYTESNRKLNGGYDYNLVKESAKQMNVPTYLLEAGVIAHEQQHLSDYEKYSLLGFSGFEKSTADNSRVKQRRAELSDRMEALAMTAELQAMRELVRNSKQSQKSYQKQIDRKRKKIEQQLSQIQELQNQIAQFDNNAQLSNKDIATKKKLEQKLKTLEEKRNAERWDDQLLGLEELVTFGPMSDEELESFMLKMYGDARIDASGTKYVDAYQKYAKQYDEKKKKWQKISLKKQRSALAAAEKNYQPVLMDYFQEHFQKKIDATPDGEETVHVKLPTGRRPVCRPCMVGDTIGQCRYAWCANGKGTPCKNFKRQPGDYIPVNYNNPIEELQKKMDVKENNKSRR